MFWFFSGWCFCLLYKLSGLLCLIITHLLLDWWQVLKVMQYILYVLWCECISLAFWIHSYQMDCRQNCSIFFLVSSDRNQKERLRCLLRFKLKISIPQKNIGPNFPLHFFFYIHFDWYHTLKMDNFALFKFMTFWNDSIIYSGCWWILAYWKLIKYY